MDKRSYFTWKYTRLPHKEMMSGERLAGTTDEDGNNKETEDRILISF